MCTLLGCSIDSIEMIHEITYQSFKQMFITGDQVIKTFLGCFVLNTE